LRESLETRNATAMLPSTIKYHRHLRTPPKKES
jgi:hypothetical protein